MHIALRVALATGAVFTARYMNISERNFQCSQGSDMYDVYVLAVL
jgi:hypothetical protein